MLVSSFVAAVAPAPRIHGWFDPLQRWNLRRPPTPSAPDGKPLLAYIPGLDGSNGSPFVHFPRLGDTFKVRAQDVSDSDSACAASFDMIVDDVAAYLRERGPGTVVMGESMGGVVAAGVALRHPELVSGLILVNPATALTMLPELQRDVRWIQDGDIPEPLFTLALFLKVGSKAFDVGLLATAVRDIFVERRMEKLRADDPALARYYDEALEDFVGQLTAQRPSSFWRGRLTQLEEGCAYVEPRLSSLRVPTLVVAGTADALLLSEREAARLQQLIPKCDVRLVAGAGHAGTLDQRIDLPAVIESWASEQGVPVC